MKKNEIRSKIRSDMMEQLERNGTVGEHYVDMVDDYMKFWDIKEELIADIKRRGAVYEYETTAHTMTWKKNDCIAELNKVNDRMLKIMDMIGIKPINNGCDIDDEEM